MKQNAIKGSETLLPDEISSRKELQVDEALPLYSEKANIPHDPNRAEDARARSLRLNLVLAMSNSLFL